MEIRHLRIGEEKEAIQLSDKVFRDREQKSMGDAFPMLFSREVIENSYGCFVDDKLVSFMGLAPSTIRVGNAKLSVYSLGAVCTDPDYRGYGYASLILEVIMTDLQRTEASLLFVSGGRSLYTRVGCVTFGKSHIVHVKGRPMSTPPLEIREAEPTDILSMTKLAAEREVAFEQTAHDMTLLIQSESYASCVKRKHRVLVAEKDGRLTGYVIVALPYLDSENQETIGIEWGGDSDAIKSLTYDAMSRYDVKEICLHVPWHEKDLLNAFGDCQTEVEKNQGTVYVVSPTKLIEQLKPYLDEHRKEFSAEVEKAEQGISITTTSGEKTLLSHEEFASLLFDPDSDGVKRNQSLSIPLPYMVGLNYI
jgi:GNAT superfamily N-acetyltransferase